MKRLLVLGIVLLIAVPASAARLSIVASQDAWPIFSPSGARIAFTRIYNRRLELWVADLHSRRVTRIASSNAQLGPTWVGAELIAWSAGGALWIARPDGTARTRYDAPLPSYSPAWRPNTAQDLAYLTHANAANLDLWVAHLLWARNAIGHPAWSPDGTRLAFQRDDGIYVTTGPAQEQRVATVDNPGSPSWSPDGKTIAYVANETLYTVPATGGAPTAVESTALTQAAPSWSRNGAHVDVEGAWSPVSDLFVEPEPRPACPGHRGLHSRLGFITGSCAIQGTSAADVIDGTRSWGDLILAGAGNDRIHANDGHTDRVNCGPGRDTVWADRTDRLAGCEIVHR